MHTETQLITVPLRKYVAALIGHKSLQTNYGTAPVAVIDMEDATVIVAADPNECICHVEMPGDNDNGQSLPRLWFIKNWRDSYEKYIIAKRVNEEARLKANLRAEKIDRVCKKIKERLSALDDSTVLVMATKGVDSGNTEMLAMFGIKEGE